MKWVATLLGCGILLTGALAKAEIPVHLEIVRAERGSVDGPTRWTERLQRSSLASLRVRAARPGDRPRVERRGTPRQPTLHVTALLNARNELQVPNASFRSVTSSTGKRTSPPAGAVSIAAYKAGVMFHVAAPAKATSSTVKVVVAVVV